MQRFPAKIQEENNIGRYSTELKNQNGEHRCKSNNFNKHKFTVASL